MDRQSNQIETLFRQASQKQLIQPSPKVLKGLRRKLAIADFLSFNPRKVNFVYTSIILAGIGSAFWLTQQKDALPQLTASMKAENTMKHTKVISTSTEKPAGTSSESGLAFKALFSSIASGCAPLTVEFINQSTGGNQFHWDFGNGDQSSELNPKYTYHNAGNYTAKLRVTNAAGKEVIYTRSITVKESPVADFSIDIESSDIAARKLVLKNNSQKADAYSWDFGDGQYSESKFAQHSYSDFGIYTIHVVAKSENGCSDTARIVNKFLEKNYQLSFPVSFKPNLSERNDGYYEKSNMSGSVFYPRNFGAEKYQFEVFAPNGMKVFTANTIKQGWNGYIGARVAPAGIYKWTARGVYPNGKSFNMEGSVKVSIEEYE